jgi:hypothetical protein
LLFALIHCGPILPDRAKGVNKIILAFLWRFCPIVKSVGGRQRPSGQAMREKWRVSAVGRARTGRWQAEARLQTALEESRSQSVSTFS